MPLTATIEDIKAYLEKVEKGQITAQSLPPCPRCGIEAHHFRFHAYRERRFLIIVEMIVQSAYAPLVRFRCPGCRKTVASYPDFAIPHKHYTRQSITGFAERYVASDATTYQQAVMVTEQNSVPGYPDEEKSLAPSTVYRWITSLSRLVNTARKALNLISQDNPASSACRDLAQLTIPRSKYRSLARKERLLSCFRLLVTEAFFKATFNLSIFTKLATWCAFG
jgi:hypothetical protein